MTISKEIMLHLMFGFEGHVYRLTVANQIWNLTYYARLGDSPWLPMDEREKRLAELRKMMAVLGQTDDLDHLLRHFLQNFSESNLKHAKDLAARDEESDQQND